jgi:signal peptidase I
MPGRRRWRRWGTVLVSGASMEPTLREGDMLLISYWGRVHPADVVVVSLPGGRPLGVKRAVQHGADGWWVEGDCAAQSTDSRQLGPLPDAAVLGRAVLRYWPRPRRLS